MNMYVILIGAFLVVLMVMFGRNPIEDARKARDAQYSSDPLVGAIEKYNSEKHYSVGQFNGNGIQSLGDSAPSSSIGSNSWDHAPAAQSYQAQQPQQNQDAGGYYPPPPPGMPASPLQQQQQQQQQPVQWPPSE